MESWWRLAGVVDDEVVDVIVVYDVRNISDRGLPLATALLHKPIRARQTIVATHSLAPLA